MFCSLNKLRHSDYAFRGGGALNREWFSKHYTADLVVRRHASLFFILLFFTLLYNGGG